MIIDSFINREKILLEFLKISAFEGWSEETLKKSATESGIDQKLLPFIFENGILDLIDFFIEYQNSKSLELVFDDKNFPVCPLDIRDGDPRKAGRGSCHASLSQRDKEQNFYKKRISEKISILVYNRFLIEKPYQTSLQRFYSFAINPKNLIQPKRNFKPILYSLKNFFKISDFIWKTIDDKSVDFNFYTKRLTLTKIIFRTSLVFLKDETQDLQKTKLFVEKQILKVMKFEKFKQNLREKLQSSKSELKKLILDKNSRLKTPREILKEMPFFRLVKNKRNKS